MASAPRPDPADKTGKLVVVDLAALKALKRPVTLAEVKAVKGFADFALVRLPRLSVMPVTDEQLEANPYQPPYIHPGQDDPRIRYLQERRRELGGYLPERRGDRKFVSLPPDKTYDSMRKGSGNQQIATTMAMSAFVRSEASSVVASVT